jgi:hypothetical protein
MAAEFNHRWTRTDTDESKEMDLMDKGGHVRSGISGECRKLKKEVRLFYKS